MNLADLIRIITRRWLLIVVFALVGLLLVCLVVYKIGPNGIEPASAKYSSTATVLLDQPGVQGSAQTAALAKLAVLPQTHKHVIESREIAEMAAKKLNGAYKPKEIQDCAAAEPVLPTQVIRISACGDDPKDAAAVTNAVVESYRDWLNSRQDAANTLGPNRLVVEVVTPAEIPTGTSGFPPIVWAFLGLFGGLLFGLLTAFGVESVQSADAPAAPVAPVTQLGAGGAAPTYGTQPAGALPAVQSGKNRRRRRQA